MDIKGFWKIKEAMTFNEKFERLWRDVADIINDESTDDETKEMLSTVAEFTDDGQLLLMMPIPEGASKEEIDEAVASGELELHENGMMIYEKHPYKVEDGKITYDTGAKAEVFGEKISSWDEIKTDGDVIQLLMYRLIRA